MNWHIGIDCRIIGPVAGRADRNEIVQLVVDLLRHWHARRLRRRCEEKRVAVGIRMNNVFSGNDTGRTRLVLDDDRLAEPIRQARAHDARLKIDRSAGRIRQISMIGRCGQSGSAAWAVVPLTATKAEIASRASHASQLDFRLRSPRDDRRALRISMRIFLFPPDLTGDAIKPTSPAIDVCATELNTVAT